jgi:RNase P subunit RPR2
MEFYSGRVRLICEECGERLVLGEPEEVWLSTRTLFECECGRDVSLASRLEETEQAENYEPEKFMGNAQN